MVVPDQASPAPQTRRALREAQQRAAEQAQVAATSGPAATDMSAPSAGARRSVSTGPVAARPAAFGSGPDAGPARPPQQPSAPSWAAAAPRAANVPAPASFSTGPDAPGPASVGPDAPRAPLTRAALREQARRAAEAAERAAAERVGAERASAERAAAELALLQRAATDRAAAERVAAERAAAQRAAIHRAATERAAADRAAAERAAVAERAAAERAAVQRAAAERAAAETAEAQRAAAERAAAERAAAQRAAAERAEAERAQAALVEAERAAAERAAAERAAADRAAAERAAAERAAAEHAAAQASHTPRWAGTRHADQAAAGDTSRDAATSALPVAQDALLLAAAHELGPVAREDAPAAARVLHVVHAEPPTEDETEAHAEPAQRRTGRAPLRPASGPHDEQAALRSHVVRVARPLNKTGRVAVRLGVVGALAAVTVAVPLSRGSLGDTDVLSGLPTDRGTLPSTVSALTAQPSSASPPASLAAGDTSLLDARAEGLVSRDFGREPIPGCDPSARAAGLNGLLATEDLCTLWDGHTQMRADAASALAQLNTLYVAQFGADICVSSGYRTLQQQYAVKAQKGGLAAQPGKSNHGWGLAVDFCSSMTSGSRWDWLQANAATYGFENPDWAQPGGSGPYERWHWEYLKGVKADGEYYG